MFLHTYISYEQFFDLLVTFLFFFFIVLLGNCTRIYFDKKLNLNKIEILLSTLIVTIFSITLAKPLLKHLPFYSFVLLIFMSSAYSYEITIYFIKNKVYKLLISIINNLLKNKIEIKEDKKESK